jgi:plasmid maintenance system antidote protein VapI
MPRLVKAHPLIDTLLAEQHLKHGRALSQSLAVQPSVITKIRNGAVPVSAEMMIRIHEKFDMPIARIKALAGQA